MPLISLSGTWFGAQFWARPLSLVTRRNGGTPRPLCVHSGLGTPPLFRPPLWRSAVVSGLRRCFEQAFGSRRGSGSGTRSNSRGREARHQGREGKCGAVGREGGAAPGQGRPAEESEGGRGGREARQRGGKGKCGAVAR